jgi:hypothetical protein
MLTLTSGRAQLPNESINSVGDAAPVADPVARKAHGHIRFADASLGKTGAAR